MSFAIIKIFCESPRNSVFTPGVPASFGVTAIAGIIAVAGIIDVVWHHCCCGRDAGNTDIAGVIAVTGFPSFAKTCRDLCVVNIIAVDPAVARLVAHPTLLQVLDERSNLSNTNQRFVMCGLRWLNIKVFFSSKEPKESVPE